MWMCMHVSKSNPTFHLLAVEFRHTHPVDPEKLARLRSAGIPTLEISISDIPALTPEGLPNRPGILALLRDPDTLAKQWIHEPHNDSLTTRCLEHFQRLATEALTTLKTRLEKEIDPKHFFHLKNHGFKPRKVYEYWVGPGERIRDVYCPQPNTTKVDPDEVCTTCPHFGGYNLYQKSGDKKPTKSVMCGLICPRFRKEPSESKYDERREW